MVSSGYQVRLAPLLELYFASLLCLATARRKLLPLIRIADDGRADRAELQPGYLLNSRSLRALLPSLFGMLSRVRDR